MKKLASFLSILCVINVLMLAGLAGFLWGTGRIDKPKVLAIGDLLRQPGSPEGLRAKLYEIMTPTPQTQPATATTPANPLAASDPEIPATAQARIDYVQKLLEQERLRLDAEAQKQQHERELLAAQAQKLDAWQKTLEGREKAEQDTLAAADAKADAAGYQKMMSILNELKPKQVKDLLVTMPAAEVARYVNGMEPDQAAKVLSEFKSPEEKQLMNSVLDKVRGAKNDSGTGAASGLTAATQSVAAASAGKAGP